MPSTADLRTHRTWQEAVGIGLGAVAALSPWITGQTGDQTILGATAAAGAVVLLLSAVQLMSLSRGGEFVSLICGLWLLTGPFALGFSATPMGVLHLVIGAAVTALAALELWQDWNLTDQDLERYGSA